MKALATSSARASGQPATSAAISSPARSGLVPRRPLPGRDDRAPQPFHVVEQVLAAGLADHLAEQVPEQPDIPAQWDRQLGPVTFPAHVCRA